MTDAPFFSDIEAGPMARTVEQIDEATWKALRGTIERFIHAAAFGSDFPEKCRDDVAHTYHNDEEALISQLEALVPGFHWRPVSTGFGSWETPMPTTMQVLDVLQVCWRYVAEPVNGKWHDFPQHYHLRFDQPAGQTKFRHAVNEVFERRGIAFELGEDGGITRLGPPVVRETLASATFASGDDKVDALLSVARTEFLDTNPANRRRALDSLWDAFSRLKTVEDANVKRGATMLLDLAFPEPKLRERAERDMVELTEIGNEFDIRHHETRVTPITDASDVDYLFSRMYALIHALLAKTGRLTEFDTAIEDDASDVPW